MANAGKKRASTSASKRDTSGSKRIKITNKKASSLKGPSASRPGSGTGSGGSRLGTKKTAIPLHSIPKLRGAEAYRFNTVKASKAERDLQIGSTRDDLVKDRKGKRVIKEYINLPGLRTIRKPENIENEEEEEDGSDLNVEDMLKSAEEKDEEDEEDQDFSKRASFLVNMNARELSRSRAFLTSQHRLTKALLPPSTSKLPIPGVSNHRDTRIPLPKIGRATVNVNSDDEENLDELDEDDFANMGSSDFDDSDMEDDQSSDMEENEIRESVQSQDESEIDAMDEGVKGEDVDGNSDLEEQDEEEESWAGINTSSVLNDVDEDSGTGTSTSSYTLRSNSDSLEDRHASLYAKKIQRAQAEERRKRPSRLPTFRNGTTVLKENTASASPEAEAGGNRIVHASIGDKIYIDSQEQTNAAKEKDAAPRPNPFGARFGRPSILSILEMSSRSQRLSAAREEIAQLGREIVGEPELGVNHLRRLQGFTSSTFVPSGSKKDEGIIVETPIRGLAMLSLLAVFLDIIPGYRIRSLTEAERNQRTTQIILQQREFEEGLVTTYRRFLETCEEEINLGSVLAPLAIKCLCDLVREKNFFNYATNIMEIVCKVVSRREFDNSSELCVATISHILLNDIGGQSSLEIVRVLSRIIKARSYIVHPAILGCLLSLRFSDLSGIRASTDRVDRRPHQYPAGKNGFVSRSNGPGRKGKPVFLNKKARKAIKEKNEIEEEIKEAESSVKMEDRSKNSTETLKLIFALYLRILKLPVDQNSPLLPATLEGLAKFSQLVNVDFFKDLLAVLRDIMMTTKIIRVQLLCVITAVDLLSGQGEALNIDLTAFITHLYSLLLPLTLSASLEEKPSYSIYSPRSIRFRDSFNTLTESELLFHCLRSIFLTSRLPNPPVRSLAFSKRLLISCLHWPKLTVNSALDFVRQLLVKERQLETMLNTEDRKRDGLWRYEIDVEGLSNPEATVWWELGLLEKNHFDEEVRAAAANLARSNRED